RGQRAGQGGTRAGAPGRRARERPPGPDPLADRDAGRAAVRPAAAGRPQEEKPLTVPGQAGAAAGEARGGGRGGGGRQAAQVAAGILLSRVLGYVRQRAIAYYIGNGWAADALTVAQRIPNTIRNLLAE